MEIYRAPRSIVSISFAEKILEESPFVGIGNLSSINLDLILSNAKADKKFENIVHDFSDFINLNPYPKLSQKLLKENKRKHYGPFQYLDLSDRFLAQLTSECVVPSHLENHFSYFESYCDQQMEAGKLFAQSLGAVVCPMLLEAFIRWQSVENMSDQIMVKFEALLQRVNDKIKHPDSDFSELIEIKNTLIVTYVVVAECLGEGISSSVLAYHLVIYRHNSIKRWNSLHPRLKLQYASICLNLFLRFYRLDERFSEKYGFSSNTLGDLHSVFYEQIQSTSDRAFLSYRQLFQWFMERIESEAFNSSDTNSDSRAFQGLSPSEHMLMVELMRRFSSYRLPITMVRFEEFLLQFKTTKRIRAILRLLEGLKFYPLWRLAEVVEEILKKEVQTHGSVVVAPLGDLTGSTAIINYLASHANLNSVRFAENLEQALSWTENGGRIYFVDDCILSGTQTINVVLDILGLRDHKSHHTKHSNSLDLERRQQFFNRKLVFTYCVASDFSINRLRMELPEKISNSINFDIIYGIPELQEVKAFDIRSPIPWESSEEREDLRSFCATVGFSILEDRENQKKWPKGRRQESALGYSDFQRLIVFPYSVPKTTLTLLWHKGTDNFPWTPLFKTPDD